MLRMSGSLKNIPVVSLRTGTQIALATEPILNPHNLKIIGWWCKVPGNGQIVLLSEDVREITSSSLAVNDDDALSQPEELVRHKETLETKFQLVGKAVKTKRQRVGKVEDYSYNDGMFVQKLYVMRSLVKLFTTEDTVVIDRTQILEVTDKYILVTDTDIKVSEEEMAPAISAATS